MDRPLPVPTESQEQQGVIRWARLSEGAFPALKLLHHVPNGGSRAKRTNGNGKTVSIEAQRLKREGVASGVPDLDLPVPRRGWVGLRIEMKRQGEPNNKPNQLKWQRALSEEGHFVTCCWTAEQAIEVLKWYVSGARCLPSHPPEEPPFLLKSTKPFIIHPMRRPNGDG